MVIENLKANALVGEKIVEATAKQVSSLRPESNSHYALKDGLMTKKEKVSEETKKKIDIFTKPYWG